jgi:hypothetical protein
MNQFLMRAAPVPKRTRKPRNATQELRYLPPCLIEYALKPAWVLPGNGVSELLQSAFKSTMLVVVGQRQDASR